MLTKESRIMGRVGMFEGVTGDPLPGSTGDDKPKLYEVETVEGRKQVTEEELIKGYKQEADYTRGKQQLAETVRQEARKLADEELADFTAEHEKEIAELQAKIDAKETEEEETFTDPEIKKLRAEQKQLNARLEKMQTDGEKAKQVADFGSRIDRTMAVMKEKYPEMSEMEVVAALQAQGKFNPKLRDEDIEKAAKRSHEFFEERVANRSAAEKKKAEELISTTLPPGGLPPSTVKRVKSWDEAFKASKEELEAVNKQGG